MFFLGVTGLEDNSIVKKATVNEERRNETPVITVRDRALKVEASFELVTTDKED